MFSSIDLSDSALISSFKSGDETAFEILLNRHKDKIFSFILSKLRDYQLANDIFQDTFIKVINTLKSGSYNEEGKFLPWVMRIAHNLIIDHFRKNKKIRVISENSSFDENYSVFNKIACESKNYLQQICTDELESHVIQLVDLLPKVQRDIIDMRIFQGLSFKEISEIEKISINTALGRMRYALMNIRKLILKKGIVVDI